MKCGDLKKLLKQPESERLEFKVRIPNMHTISSILVAFANTNGGKLIIGIDARKRIVGIDNIEHAHQIINKAANTISPPLKINIQTIEIEEKKILVVEIPKGNKSPYFSHGQAWQRVVADNVPLTSKNLFPTIMQRSMSIEDFTKEIKCLSDIVERLNKDLISARSWKVKIIDMIIGGVIGTIISLFIILVIGVF